MKKDYSVVSQISTRRQLLLYPPSKSSSQKTAVEATQKESKNENVTSVNFMQRTMQTLSEYELEFQELF